MIALALLILINLWILQTTREPQVLVEVKQRYRTLREHIASTKNEKYTMLTKNCTHHRYEADEGKRWVQYQ